MSTTVPNPSVMARFKKPVFEKPALVTALVAEVEPEHDAKIVRPGLRTVTEYVEHDGVVKAKHLKEGMEVRAFLHGAPRGGKRVVKSIERIDDGAQVRVEFSSPHPTTDYKAAYRFHVEALVGTPVPKVKQVPALVPYEEV